MTTTLKSSALGLAHRILRSKNASDVPTLLVQLAKSLTVSSTVRLQQTMVPRRPKQKTTGAPAVLLEGIRKSTTNTPTKESLKRLLDEDDTRLPLSEANATYGETHPSTIRTILNELVSSSDEELFTGRFVDAGSGNGIATLTAALEGRFPTCTGVEYDLKRHEQALQLKEAYDGLLLPDSATTATTSTLEFTNGDIAEESFDGASVVFANCVCWDAQLVATAGQRLEEATLEPGAYVITISRQLACPSFDLVDRLTLPCNGGKDFTFYVSRKADSSSLALSDSPVQQGLREAGGLLEALVELVARQEDGSNEGLALFAALASSEPTTRFLIQECRAIKIMPLLATKLVTSRCLATRASASMVLRAMSNHPVGRRGIANNNEQALLQALRRKDEHPALQANLLDIVGQCLHDPVANERLGELGIDDVLRELLQQQQAREGDDVVEACIEAQTMRRWWSGEQRSLDDWSV